LIRAAQGEVESQPFEPFDGFPEGRTLKELCLGLVALAVPPPPVPMEQSPLERKIQAEQQRRFEIDRDRAIAEKYAEQTGRRVA
jgi:hypothetical protein